MVRPKIMKKLRLYCSPILGELEYFVSEDLSGELEAVFIDVELSLLNEPARCNRLDRHTFMM